MIASLLGLTLGILFRVDYRRLDLPRPAPPRIFGALLIVFITLGVLSTGLTLAHIGRDV